jgi:hypothetical protein
MICNGADGDATRPARDSRPCAAESRKLIQRNCRNQGPLGPLVGGDRVRRACNHDRVLPRVRDHEALFRSRHLEAAAARDQLSSALRKAAFGNIDPTVEWVGQLARPVSGTMAVVQGADKPVRRAGGSTRSCAQAARIST